eukprot:gene2954-4964_t
MLKLLFSDIINLGSSEGKVNAYVPPNTKYYNIFVLGAVNSGKSTFIRSSSKNMNCLGANVELESDSEISSVIKSFFTNMVTTMPRLDLFYSKVMFSSFDGAPTISVLRFFEIKDPEEHQTEFKKILDITDGILFVYDLNDPESSNELFQIVIIVLSKMKKFSSSFPMLLIGNKSDLSSETKEIDKLAKELFYELQLSYVLVSSKKVSNVMESNELLIQLIEEYKKRQ